MNALNSELIVEKNRSTNIIRRPQLSQGWIVHEDKNPTLDFESIKRLLRFISGIHNKFHTHRPMLSISFPSVQAVDKLTLQVLESILYSLINDYGHKVTVFIQLDPQIHSEGFKYSPLHYLSLYDYNAEQFNKTYETDIRLSHYRRVVPKEWTYNGELGDYIIPDLMSTLSHYIDDESYSFALAEVISELVNNANEHNAADCLLDLDITGDYHKRDGSEGNYIGINVSIISFANTYIYEPLKDKIITKKYRGDRYERIVEVYETHKGFFGENYTDTEFFTIAAFQDRISGRASFSASGGTGLTKLLQSLEKYSDSSMCYMVSNDKALYFFKELLDYDSEGWIGFNLEHDFLGRPPASFAFQKSPILFPGIGYNLTFVYKKGAGSDVN